MRNSKVTARDAKYRDQGVSVLYNWHGEMEGGTPITLSNPSLQSHYKQDIAHVKKFIASTVEAY